MTVRASTLVQELSPRPVDVLPLEVPAAPNLPTVVAPPPAGRVLFAVADRLVDGMHEAARGKGMYPAPSWVDRMNSTMPGWCVAVVLGSAIGCGIYLPGRDTGLLGFFAGIAACVPLGALSSMSARTCRAKPLPPSVAEPYLAAFESGSREVQAIVRQLAAEAAESMSAHRLTGDKARAQLGEIAAVAIDLDASAQKRVSLMCKLASVLPRRDREEASSHAILEALEQLDPADRADIAPQLKAHLFRFGRLRWALKDNQDAEALAAALEGRKTLTSRSDLQKLVAPRSEVTS